MKTVHNRRWRRRMKRRWKPFGDLMMRVLLDGVGSISMEELLAKTPIGDMARRAVNEWAKARRELEDDIISAE